MRKQHETGIHYLQCARIINNVKIMQKQPHTKTICRKLFAINCHQVVFSMDTSHHALSIDQTNIKTALTIAINDVFFLKILFSTL